MNIDVYRGEWNEAAHSIYATSVHVESIAQAQGQMATTLGEMSAQLARLREDGGSLITRADGLLIASIVEKLTLVGRRMDAITRRLNGTTLPHGT